MTALLLAEPEASMRGFLERQLSSDGFDVLAFSSPEELPRAAEPDVLVLGDPGALDRCLVTGCPVIVLGSPDAETRLRALELCDDYLARPFVYEELVARIRALLRRRPLRVDVIDLGELVVDRPARRVIAGGVDVVLSAKEYALLAAARIRPDAGVHARAAPARRVGISELRADEDARVARLARALQARRRGAPRLGRQRVGCGVQAASHVRLGERALEPEQALLVRQTTRISRELARRADETVTRDHDRQRVARIRAADGTRAVRETEASSLLGVRARLAVRDLQQREPRAPLERRAGEIERKRELRAPSGEVLRELLLRLLDERPRPDRLAVAPVEPLQALLGGDDPQRRGLLQSNAPSSCSSCTFRSSPPA